MNENIESLRSKVYVAAKYEEVFNETVQCIEYHVTQQISDKGDTTYTIKYKPL